MVNVTKQTDRVLQFMQEVGSISQIEALNELGVMRLASRISDLRKQGIDIIGKTEPVRNRYGETCYVKRYMLRDQHDAM